MRLEEDLVSKVRTLQPHQQREVLDFASWLSERNVRKKGKSLAGLWSKYDINLSEEDFKQLRSEAWSGFPRDF